MTTVQPGLWFSNFCLHRDHLGALLQCRCLGATSRASDSAGLQLGLRKCLPRAFTWSQCCWPGLGLRKGNTGLKGRCPQFCFLCWSSSGGLLSINNAELFCLCLIIQYKTTSSEWHNQAIWEYMSYRSSVLNDLTCRRVCWLRSIAFRMWPGHRGGLKGFCEGLNTPGSGWTRLHQAGLFLCFLYSGLLGDSLRIKVPLVKKLSAPHWLRKSPTILCKALWLQLNSILIPPFITFPDSLPSD